MAKMNVINKIKEDSVMPIQGESPHAKKHTAWLIGGVIFVLLVIAAIGFVLMTSDGPVAGQAIKVDLQEGALSEKGAVGILLHPEESVVQKGDSVTLPVYLNYGGEDVGGDEFNFILEFNPDLLEFDLTKDLYGGMNDAFILNNQFEIVGDDTRIEENKLMVSVKLIDSMKGKLTFNSFKDDKHLVKLIELKGKVIGNFGENVDLNFEKFVVENENGENVVQKLISSSFKIEDEPYTGPISGGACPSNGEVIIDNVKHYCNYDYSKQIGKWVIEVGESCTNNPNNCGQDLVCETGVCKGNEGFACAEKLPTDNCANGLKCDSDDDECVPGKKTNEIKKKGDVCTLTSECGSGLACVNKKCAGLGDVCINQGSDIKTNTGIGLYCEDTWKINLDYSCVKSEDCIGDHACAKQTFTESGSEKTTQVCTIVDEPCKQKDATATTNKNVKLICDGTHWKKSVVCDDPDNTFKDNAAYQTNIPNVESLKKENTATFGSNSEKDTCLQGGKKIQESFCKSSTEVWYSNYDCPTGYECKSGAGACTSIVGTCTDKIKNNDETDVDCGGSCSTKCADTKLCASSSDCAAGLGCLDSKTCGVLKTVVLGDVDGIPGLNVLDVLAVVDHIIDPNAQLTGDRLKSANVIGCKKASPVASDINIQDVLAIVDAILDGKASIICSG